LDGAITSLNITPASTVLTDRWVPPIALLADPVEYWCSRSRAFFTATTAGPHSNGTQVRRLLAHLLRWSEINNFYTVPTQMSQPIELEVGQSILLEGAQCNTVSRGHIQVGWAR
ncbi:fibrocystin-L, partial [Haematococcus lacustris]